VKRRGRSLGKGRGTKKVGVSDLERQTNTILKLHKTRGRLRSVNRAKLCELRAGRSLREKRGGKAEGPSDSEKTDILEVRRKGESDSRKKFLARARKKSTEDKREEAEHSLRGGDYSGRIKGGRGPDLRISTSAKRGRA